MSDELLDSTGIADRLRDYVIANHRDPDCCGLARMLSEAVEAIRASEAARAQAEQALRQIAEHDNERFRWVQNSFERQPSPQQLATAALAALSSSTPEAK